MFQKKRQRYCLTQQKVYIYRQPKPSEIMLWRKTVWDVIRGWASHFDYDTSSMGIILISVCWKSQNWQLIHRSLAEREKRQVEDFHLVLYRINDLLNSKQQLHAISDRGIAADFAAICNITREFRANIQKLWINTQALQAVCFDTVSMEVE